MRLLNLELLSLPDCAHVLFCSALHRSAAIETTTAFGLTQLRKTAGVCKTPSMTTPLLASLLAFEQSRFFFKFTPRRHFSQPARRPVLFLNSKSSTVPPCAPRLSFLKEFAVVGDIPGGSLPSHVVLDPFFHFILSCKLFCKSSFNSRLVSHSLNFVHR